MPPLPKHLAAKLKTRGPRSPSSPTATAKAEGGWEEVGSRVQYVNEHGEFVRFVKVVAKMMGRLGVHQGVGRHKDRWAVSHLPTGLLTGIAPTEEEAKRMASFLWGRFCRAYSKTTREEVVAALPGWVQTWVKECLAKGAYLDPGPYEKGA